MGLDVFKLDGRVALVTGSCQGLGWVMAQALAEAGADVVLTSRDQDKAQACAADLAKATGCRSLGVGVDVTVSEQVQAMVETVVSEFGRIDILVNNAGVNIRKPIEAFDEASWDIVQDTNLKAPYLCARAVAPYMKAQKSGRVVNLASMLGLVALAGAQRVLFEQGRAYPTDKSVGAGMGFIWHHRERTLSRADCD